MKLPVVHRLRLSTNVNYLWYSLDDGSYLLRKMPDHASLNLNCALSHAYRWKIAKHLLVSAKRSLWPFLIIALDGFWCCLGWVALVVEVLSGLVALHCFSVCFVKNEPKKLYLFIFRKPHHAPLLHDAATLLSFTILSMKCGLRKLCCGLLLSVAWGRATFFVPIAISTLSLTWCSLSISAGAFYESTCGVVCCVVYVHKYSGTSTMEKGPSWLSCIERAP